jgi:WD40 repeat protein
MREIVHLQDVGGPDYAVALAADDKTLAVGGHTNAGRDATFGGGAIRLYDVPTGKEKSESAKAWDSWIRAAAVSHDRTLLAVAQQDKTLKLVETPRLKDRSILRGHAAPALALSFAQDDHTLYSGSLDKSVGVWDVPKGIELPPPLHGQAAGILALALSPDGRQLASGSPPGGQPPSALKLWDTVGRKELATLPAPAGGVVALDFYREGKNSRLVSAGKDGAVRVWDTARAKEVFVINGAHPGGVSGVAVSPRNKTIVSVGEDGTFKVWDAGLGKADPSPLFTGRNVVPLGTVPAPYRAVAFAPDGKLLAVGCQRGGLTLYDTGTWKDVRTWKWPGGIVQLTFDTSGKHLLSVNNNGTAYVLRLPLYR